MSEELEDLGTSLDPKELFVLENSPIAQYRHWSPLEPYKWQMAVWDALWRPGALVSVRTCNESGKSSYLVPISALAFAAAFPGSQTVITSYSKDQIEEQLAPAIKAMAKSHGWHCTADKITAPPVDGLPGSTILFRVTKEGERFEGYHVRTYEDKYGNARWAPLFIIVDEGKSVKPEIYEAIERCNPTMQLNISTTGADSGDFYESCMNVNGLWTTEWEFQDQLFDFKIDWLQCPHLCEPGTTTYKRKKAYLDANGPNDPKVASILLAEFFRSGTFMVFQDSDIKVARTSMSGMIPEVHGGRRAFCDFSGGGDELVFGVRDGNTIHPFVAWNRDGNTPPSVEAEKYIRLFKEWELTPGQISGDNGGLGALIISEMELRGWPIVRINANKPPRDKDQFVDRYAEMHWMVKKHLHSGMLRLPKDDVLLDQMRLRRYVMKNTEDNKIRIESKQDKDRKKRREVSPDRLDTLVHLCVNMPKLPDIKKMAERNNRTGSPDEFWRRIEREKEQESALGGDWD